MVYVRGELFYMSWFTKWAFKNKAAVMLLSALILVMGVVSYFTLPMELLPSADNPQVTVVTMGQGIDSKTMEQQVTNQIENAVVSVKGKRNIYSTTGDGFSKVDISFEPKTKMKEAKQEVQDALSSLTLPEHVSKPNIVQLNTSMIPISNIAITFKEGLTQENIELAKKKVIPMYKEVKGVANVQTFGTENAYVSVDIDPKKMAEKQISLESVMTSLQGQNMSVAIGEKIIEGKASNLKVVGPLKSVDDVKNTKIGPNVKLNDIASVEVKKPGHTMTRMNGENALLLIVSKESNANAVSTSKKVIEMSKEINDKYKQLHSEVIISNADMIENSVNSMMKEVLLGALFATIVIMLFLRNIRSTFITIVSIPLSLGFTLFLLSKSGVTLNILTLGGVAVAVGRLVDDSIVVIENIFRKMQTEKFSIQLITDATKEVGSAITASTLTTVAVFLPIGLVNGGLEQFLLPFALTVTYSLLTSLIVALTVVPIMSAGLLKNSKLPKHKPAKRFTRFLAFSLNHKWIVYLLSLIMFVGSIGAYFMMPKGAVDQSSAMYIEAALDYPNNTPLEKVKENTLKLEKMINEQKEVKYSYTQLGNSEDAAKYGDVSSPTKASIILILKDKEDTEKVMKRIEKEKNNYSNGKLKVQSLSFMSSSSSDITIDVLGDDLAAIEKTASEVKKRIKGIDGIETVATNQDAKKTVYSFDLNSSEVNTNQVTQQLAVLLNPTPIGTVQVESQNTMIMLEPMANPKTMDDLKNIQIGTATGLTPISKVATIKQEELPTNSYHKDGNTFIRLTATVVPEKLSVVDANIKKEIFGDKKEVKGMKIPDGVKVNVGGASAQQADDFTDLFMTMFVSIGLVFIIMVVTFKTFRAPIAILCSLPLAAIGAILGLLITGISVDITALLGALMLIGVVVTNAIVLLDRVKQNEETMTIRDSLLEAAATRMRPIFMTAVATVCAMLPLLFKQAEAGSLVSSSLAIVVIGGLSLATLLTLVVIPVVYESLYFRKSKKQRIAKANQGEVTSNS